MDLVEHLKARPLTDSPDGQQSPMFRNTNNFDGKEVVERKFMNWRKAFIVLALISGKIPSKEQKEAYFSKLRTKQTICHAGKLTRQVFIKVSQIKE